MKFKGKFYLATDKSDEMIPFSEFEYREDEHQLSYSDNFVLYGFDKVKRDYLDQVPKGITVKSQLPTFNATIYEESENEKNVLLKVVEIMVARVISNEDGKINLGDDWEFFYTYTTTGDILYNLAMRTLNKRNNLAL